MEFHVRDTNYTQCHIVIAPHLQKLILRLAQCFNHFGHTMWTYEINHDFKWNEFAEVQRNKKRNSQEWMFTFHSCEFIWFEQWHSSNVHVYVYHVFECISCPNGMQHSVEQGSIGKNPNNNKVHAWNIRGRNYYWKSLERCASWLVSSLSFKILSLEHEKVQFIDAENLQKKNTHSPDSIVNSNNVKITTIFP